MSSGGERAGVFGGRVRVRANALIVRHDALLLLKMKSPTREQPFWIPPGGGVEVGETLEETLRRETLEETGIAASEPELWYISEYINEPWHAVEFYFFCKKAEGELHLGSDPELDATSQYILAGEFVHFDKLKELPLVPDYLKDRFVTDYRVGKAAPEFIAQRDERR